MVATMLDGALDMAQVPVHDVGLASPHGAVRMVECRHRRFRSSMPHDRPSCDRAPCLCCGIRLTLRLVHVPGLAADVRLAHFRLRHPSCRTLRRLHREPDARQHEPRGLLGHADGAVQFVAGNAVLVHQQPHSGKPLVEAERAILEDRPGLDGELFPARLALPQSPRGDQRRVRTAALGARDPSGQRSCTMKAKAMSGSAK